MTRNLVNSVEIKNISPLLMHTSINYNVLYFITALCQSSILIYMFSLKNLCNCHCPFFSFFDNFYKKKKKKKVKLSMQFPIQNRYSTVIGSQRHCCTFGLSMYCAQSKENKINCALLGEWTTMWRCRDNQVGPQLRHIPK